MTSKTIVARLLHHDRRIVAAVLVLLATLAAGFIVAGGGTGMSAIDMARQTGPAGALMSGTPDMPMPMHWSFGYASVIFLMWWLMMVAMMLPSAAPTILLFGVLNPSRGVWGMLEFLLGYFSVWAGFSVAATMVQASLTATGLASPMYMNLSSSMLAAAVLILVGGYQFTPIKTTCLKSCRGPVEALTRGRKTGTAAAFRMGIAHGGYCLGCCWALMALLFVGGVMNLWWILAIAIYVAVEKLTPYGERFAKPVGFALVVAGGFIAARASSFAGM
jgi:predicted metal-binding membrane protein